MKQSSSQTSLDALNPCDTACYFCAEPEDLEGGQKLQDSKEICNCPCRQAFHARCWADWTDMGMEGAQVPCAVCKEPVLSWKKLSIDEEEQEIIRRERIARQDAFNLKIMYLFVILVILFITLLAAFTFGHS